MDTDAWGRADGARFLKISICGYVMSKGSYMLVGGDYIVFYARDYEIVRPASGLSSYRAVPVPRGLACSYYFSLFSSSPKGIVCPHFWELKWAVGCPYRCSYCFLQGTLYGNKMFRLKDLSRLGKKLDELLSWADSEGVRLLLNAGELCDSLAVPGAIAKLVDVLKGVLMNHPHHRVLLVTKAGLRQVRKFLEVVRGFEDFFVISFSINSYRVSKMLEIAPPVDDRLRAAKAVQDAGISMRVRLDPMVPVEGWEEDYKRLVEEVLTFYGVNPERLTVGSLRGLQKTIRFSKDRSWVKYLEGGEKTGWGLKVVPETRKSMYSLVLETARQYGYRGATALCKETVEMWLKLGKEGLIYDPGEPGVWQNVTCNCRL